MLAAAFGRGYLGRHRLAEVALGVQQVESAPVLPVTGADPTAIPTAIPTAMPAGLPTALPTRLPAAPMVFGGARLAVVTVSASPDPLVDTAPHPVVKLFPLPVEEIHDAVFAGEDAEREQASTIDLAQATREHEYHARHSA